LNNSEIDCSTKPFSVDTIGLKQYDEYTDNNNIIIIATLSDNNSNRIDRNYFINGRWKHKEICKSKIDIEISKHNFKLTAISLSLFVDVHHPEVIFSDRAFIMLSGESVVLDCQNVSDQSLDENLIKIFTLNNYLES